MRCRAQGFASIAAGLFAITALLRDVRYSVTLIGNEVLQQKW